MSFKQAKELVERMEFSEIALKNATKVLDESYKTFGKASENFDKTLNKQEEILGKLPKLDKKMSYMFLAVAINIGFILGLLIGKYIL
ncbi:hypothetical protein Q4582_11625 [Poseidonibacter sp. 1_MG-2023]|uniref:hypothetical protein n=1 Tax=Poseidonibacter TaxID=2321187 RepID=UPI001E56F559|nr:MULTISPECIES: hypothetical protein [Poseidonibacter]MDO6828712.1 hypothetical protein [Poseidonibacter sp. 1_MG-2023]